MHTKPSDPGSNEEAERQEPSGIPATGLPPSLYRFVWQVSRRDQLRLLMLSSAVAVLAMVPLEIQRRIVNGVLAQGTLRSLAWLCGAYVAVVLVQGGLKYLMNFCRALAGENAIRDLRRRIYCGAVYERMGSEREGSVVAMVSSEVEPLGEFVGEGISTPLVEGGTLASVFGYMLWVEPVMALASIAVLCPQLYFVPVMQRKINERNKRRTQRLRELAEGIVDDAARETADIQVDTSMERIERVRGLRLQTFGLKYAMKFLVNLMNHLGTVGVLFIGAWFVLEGRTELGTVVAFLSGMERVNDPWRQLIRFFRQLTDARVKYRLIADALEGERPREHEVRVNPS